MDRRLTIVQTWTKDVNWYAESAASSKMELAGRHRLGFRASVVEPVPLVHPAWMKLPYLMRVLSQIGDGNWAWQTDADLYITNMQWNPHNCLSIILQMAPEIDILIGQDENGINSGSFFIKSSNKTLKFLDKCFADRHRTDNHFAEQSAIARYLSSSEEDGLNCFTSSTRHPFNIYPREWEKGDPTIHLPGEWIPKRATVDDDYLRYTVR